MATVVRNIGQFSDGGVFCAWTTFRRDGPNWVYPDGYESYRIGEYASETVVIFPNGMLKFHNKTYYESNLVQP